MRRPEGKHTVDKRGREREKLDVLTVDAGGHQRKLGVRNYSDLRRTLLLETNEDVKPIYYECDNSVSVNEQKAGI